MVVLISFASLISCFPWHPCYLLNFMHLLPHYVMKIIASNLTKSNSVDASCQLNRSHQHRRLLPASWLVWVHGAMWGEGTLGARSWLASIYTYASAILGRAWRRTQRSRGHLIVWWWWWWERRRWRGWADPSPGMDYEGIVQARVWIFCLAPPTYGDSLDQLCWLGRSYGVRLHRAYAPSRGHLLED